LQPIFLAFSECRWNRFDECFQRSFSSRCNLVKWARTGRVKVVDIGKSVGKGNHQNFKLDPTPSRPFLNSNHVLEEMSFFIAQQLIFIHIPVASCNAHSRTLLRQAQQIIRLYRHEKVGIKFHIYKIQS